MRQLKIAILFIICTSFAFAGLSPDRFDNFLGEHWYGIYMNDQKIGYASIGLTHESQDRWTMRFDQSFTFEANQMTVTMTSSETRTYEGENAELVSNHYINSSDVGNITVDGGIIDNSYKVTTDIFGQKTENQFKIPIETLDEALSIEMAAATNKLNKDSHFDFEVFVADPPLTGLYKHVASVINILPMVINGVDTKVYMVRDSIPQLGLGTNTSYDEYGNMLSQEVPSMMMVLKSEPEEIARQIEVGYDILRDNLVKAPNGPANPRPVTEGKYILSGYEINRLPKSDWLKINEFSADSAEIAIQQLAKESYVPSIPIDNSEFEEYLKPEPLIQSDNAEIVDLAKSIIGDEKNVFTAAQLISNWVYHNIKKEFSPDISNALQTLKSGRGDCGEHSALTVALLRAVGIPARIVAGVVYWPDGGGFAYHAWVEVYVGEWIQIDPTLNEPFADATHIMLARGGLQNQLIAILGALKSMKIQILSFK
jgi:hypothetical protein